MRRPFSSPFLLYVLYLFMFSIYIRIRCAHSDQWLQRPLEWQISSLNLVSGCVYPLSTGHCPLWVYINSLHQSHQKYTHHSLPPQQSAPPQSCPPQDTGATIYSFSGSNFIHLSLSHIQCRGQTTLAPSPKSTLSAHMLWRSVIRPCDLMDWDVFLVRILEWADTSSSGELDNLGIEPTSPGSLRCRPVLYCRAIESLGKPHRNPSWIWPYLLTSPLPP